MNSYNFKNNLWKKIKRKIVYDYPNGEELLFRVRLDKSKNKNILKLIVANRKDKKEIKTNFLPEIKKCIKEISADKIKVRFAYNKTWKPLLQAYYKSGSIIKLFIFFLLFCTIIISFIISLSKGNLTFVIISSIFITFFVDFNNKVLIPFMSFYRNLTNVFELERDVLKPKIDKIAEENLQSPKYLKYDYQWDSYDGIEWFLSSSIINEHLKNKASKMTLRMDKKKATFPEEAKNYLALVISTKLKDNKKIFNNCLIGLDDDFDLDMTQVGLKKTDYYSYVSIDEMIYKTIKSKQIISYELNGSMFSVSKSGYLYDMKNAICSNIVGINIIIRTKDDYLLISRQADENDENQNKWVPSASGSLDYNDYTSGTKSFASLLFAGMFRELKEETGIDYRYNKKDILDIHLLGYVRLLKKGGKPDFFSQCKVDKTKDELKEILDKVRKKRTTEIQEFSFINLKPLFNSDVPFKALIKDIYGLKISLQLYFTLFSIVKEEKKVISTACLKNDFKFPNLA